jgi:hypothetical protein
MSAIGVQIRRNNAYQSIEQIEDRGITVRSPSTSLLLVDSKDRYRDFVQASQGTTSPYDFNIYKAQSILNGFFHRIALTEIVFPWAIYNMITPLQSISFTYDDGVNPPATSTITLGNPSPLNFVGFFTPDEIAAELQTQILLVNPALAGTTVAYINGYMNFLFPVGVTASFDRDPALTPTAYQLFDFLNMNADNTVLQNVQLSGYTRCRWTEYVDIVCSQLTYNQDLKDSSTSYFSQDVLARVYLEDEDNKIIPVWDSTNNEVLMPVDTQVLGTYPSVIYRKFPHPKQIQWNNEQPIGNLRFQVFDDKGRILTSYDTEDLPDYKLPNWRMSLLVSEN